MEPQATPVPPTPPIPTPPTPEPIQPPIQLPIQPVPAPEQPSNKASQRWLVISSVVFLLVAIILAAFKLILKNKTTTPPEPTSTALTQPTPSPTPDPTANWKTYINNKYKYEIKFPPLWEYNRGPGNISDAELSNQRDIDIYDPNLPSGDPGTGITIKVNELDAQGNSKNCTTLEDCIEKSFSWLPKTQEVEKGETTFLGQQAKTIKYIRITPLYSQTWKYVFVILNNNFYSFSLSSETKGFNNNLVVFDQILSTFKFLGSISQNGEGLTKEECSQQGGLWQKWGLLGQEYCQIPASDGGKSCTDGSQCSLGYCIATNGAVPGKCQTYKAIFGCIKYINNGVVDQKALCSD